MHVPDYQRDELLLRFQTKIINSWSWIELLAYFYHVVFIWCFHLSRDVHTVNMFICFQHEDMESKSSLITVVTVYTDGKYKSANILITEQMNMYAVFLFGSYPYNFLWLLGSFLQRLWVILPKYFEIYISTTLHTKTILLKWFYTRTEAPFRHSC